MNTGKHRNNDNPGGKCHDWECGVDATETLRNWVISDGPIEKKACVLRAKVGVTAREGSKECPSLRRKISVCEGSGY